MRVKNITRGTRRPVPVQLGNVGIALFAGAGRQEMQRVLRSPESAPSINGVTHLADTGETLGAFAVIRTLRDCSVDLAEEIIGGAMSVDLVPVIADDHRLLDMVLPIMYAHREGEPMA